MTVPIPDFSKARVLVVGDVMLDRYWHGGTSRISPEAPVPVVHVQGSEERPGGAANVALNIAALGASVTLVGVIGQDEAGERLREIVESAGGVCRLQAQNDCPTITKLRVISRHQQLIRLDFEDDLGPQARNLVKAPFAAELEKCDVVVLSDYGKGTIAEGSELIAMAREAGKPVLVDPKGTDFSRYRGATLVTPNLGEFQAVAGVCASDDELAGKATHLLDETGIEGLLVTRSEQGMTLVQREGVKHFSARAREVFDVTGAGDTVIATLAASLAAGQALDEATALANTAAGLVVAKLGTASITAPELLHAVDQAEGISRSVVSRESLATRLEPIRAQGGRVVMTNGCFDILHAGHVASLAEARALGDCLVVAVNDDASVTRLKGEGRPVNTLSRRMAVLAALECVDWVVPFSEDTPEELICSILPDVLAKGGDYQPDEVVGHECVTANGGKVVILRYHDGESTTEIIRSIRDTER